jgi:hypothetical protein
MFWDDIDGIKTLERDSARLEGIELSQARKLMKMYQQARKEIINQLLLTPDNTFTEAKLETALRQTDQAMAVLHSRIRPDLVFGFETLFEQALEDSGREINAFEKEFNGITRAVPIDAIIASTNPDNFLFNQYEASVQNYSARLRNNFQRVLGQSLVQNKTWSQAVNDLNTVFSAQEYQLARIARTELHNIYNVSKLKGFKGIQNQYLPDLKKALYHPMDSRTGEDSIELAEDKPIVELDEPFTQLYNGRKYVFMTPPQRPNDRAILVPYRESYDK